MSNRRNSLSRLKVHLAAWELEEAKEICEEAGTKYRDEFRSLLHSTIRQMLLVLRAQGKFIALNGLLQKRLPKVLGPIELAETREWFRKQVEMENERLALEERRKRLQTATRRIQVLSRRLHKAVLSIYLKHGLFDKADKIQREFQPLNQSEFLAKRKEFQIQRSMELLNHLLENKLFKDADGHWRQTQLVSASDYVALKTPFVINALKGILKNSLSEEQAAALARLERHVLVTARAGSGKTTTIAAKVAFLCGFYGVKPQEILVMAFNKKAADEISDRIAKALQIDQFPNAMTFHALAHRIVQPKSDQLLVDSRDGGRLTQSEFVHDLIRGLWSPVFREQLYRHFRKELEEVEERGHNLKDADYLLYRRNLTHLTLKGERVKSMGEKIIADFLCEHGISYVYEKDFWSQGKSIRPDFTILSLGRDLVLEHWGIDELSQEPAPQWWNENREQYIERTRTKRAFFKQLGIELIETSIRDLRKGRADFERILLARLQQGGVECKKLSDDQLIKEIVDPKQDKIARMFLLFIQNVKRRKFDILTLNEAIREEERERVKVFHELALRVYTEYCKKLTQSDKIDFDDLLAQATRKVRDLRADFGIKAKRWNIRLSTVKWILIDEFQDFSPLFFDLVEAIREHNPDCNMLCVGDDWQAINSFAGSDLEYFQHFENYFKQTGRSHITINRRSGSDIVQYGNRLMKGQGEPANCDENAIRGEVNVIDIQNREVAFVEFRPGELSENHKDRKFLWFWDEKANKVDLSFQNASKFLKVCYEIICKNAGKSFFIISRRNDIDYADSTEIARKLKRCFSKEELKQIGSFEDKVQFMTAHRTKGLEADIVIILDVCQGVFPLLHPDHALSEVFGFTPQRVLEEERRLLYVAMTRAREKTFLVTDSSNPSDFLKELQLPNKTTNRAGEK